MRVLIDTNVVLDFLQEREPFVEKYQGKVVYPSVFEEA